MVPARTTQEAYRNCDAELPLPPGDPAYVDFTRARNQDDNFATTIAWMVTDSPIEEKSTHISLVSGHRGCGKSTELLRVRGELEKQGWAVAYFDAFAELDQNDLEASDLMIVLCEAVALLADEQGDGFDAGNLELVYDYLAKETVERDAKRETDVAVQTGVDLGGGVSGIFKLFANLRANMKGSETVRRTYRREIEKEFGNFADRVKTLVRSAEAALKKADKKGLVVIVDSLEKLPYTVEAGKPSSHERFFQLHADTLKCPPCRVLYTVPITLTAQNLLSDTYGDTPLIIPMIDLAQPDAPDCLEDVLAKRVDLGVVFAEGTDLGPIVRASGGCVRDLLRLVRAAVLAQTAPVAPSRVETAISTLTKEYDRLFDDEDIPTILRCRENGRIDYDETGRKLLYRRVILEYENGVRRMAPHPLVLANRRVARAAAAASPILPLDL